MIEGQQLLMHNRQLADPLNYYVREKAKITAKRKKTYDDHMRGSELEFHGGLYLDDKKRPIVPDKNIKAMLGDAAKSFKEGKKCLEGITVLDHAVLSFDGPKDMNKRFEKGYFRREPLKQNMSVIIRTRPIFHNWKAELEIYYDETLVDPEMLERWIDVASTYKGIGDGRPNFGRFTVKSIAHKVVTNAA